MMIKTKSAFVKSIVSSGIIRTNRIAKVIESCTDKSFQQARVDAEKQIYETLGERIYYLEVRVEDLMKTDTVPDGG